jgi:hypothetical protein
VIIADAIPTTSTLEEIEEVVDNARAFLRASTGPSEALAFAAAVIDLSDRCVIGVPCKRHSHVVHGNEAEELRKGVELALMNTADVVDDDAPDVLRSLRKSLIFLLDRIDARDSVAFLEATSTTNPQET